MLFSFYCRMSLSLLFILLKYLNNYVTNIKQWVTFFKIFCRLSEILKITDKSVISCHWFNNLCRWVAKHSLDLNVVFRLRPNFKADFESGIISVVRQVSSRTGQGTELKQLLLIAVPCHWVEMTRSTTTLRKW